MARGESSKYVDLAEAEELVDEEYEEDIATFRRGGLAFQRTVNKFGL